MSEAPQDMERVKEAYAQKQARDLLARIELLLRDVEILKEEFYALYKYVGGGEPEPPEMTPHDSR
jgi:hypothetical protein